MSQRRRCIFLHAWGWGTLSPTGKLGGGLGQPASNLSSTIFLLRKPPALRPQCKAERHRCSQLLLRAQCLHYHHLSETSAGLAAWGQDPLPEPGAQNLQVLLALELNPDPESSHLSYCFPPQRSLLICHLSLDPSS